jgi:hypothetical protein
LLGSNSTTSTVQSISGPFSASPAPSQLGSVEYPTSTGKNYLFAWQAQGGGSNQAVKVTFDTGTTSGTVFIDVIQLGASTSPVSGGTCTQSGTTPGGGSSPVCVTVQHASDSEIAFFGSSSNGQTWTQPSGGSFSSLDGASGSKGSYGVFTNPAVQATATFTMGGNKAFGSIGIEITP